MPKNPFGPTLHGSQRRSPRSFSTVGLASLPAFAAVAGSPLVESQISRPTSERSRRSGFQSVLSTRLSSSLAPSVMLSQPGKPLLGDDQQGSYAQSLSPVCAEATTTRHRFIAGRINYLQEYFNNRTARNYALACPENKSRLTNEVQTKVSYPLRAPAVRPSARRCWNIA